MTGRRLAVLGLMLVLVSCGFDGGGSGTGLTGGTSGTGISGGVSGTGISSTNLVEQVPTVVRGNVVAPGSDLAVPWLLSGVWRTIRPVTPAFAAAGVDGILVRILDTGFSTETFGGGFFEISGEIPERITVVFEDESGMIASVSTIAPAGGSVTLQDVVLDRNAMEVTRSVSFDAIVERANCLFDVAWVRSAKDPDGSTYLVQVRPASVQTPGGEELTCFELDRGSPVAVDGSVLPDGSVGG